MAKLKRIKSVLKEIIAYPPKGNSRRTKDGYPAELIYDEFAYKRMVDSYRNGIRSVLEELKE